MPLDPEHVHHGSHRHAVRHDARHDLTSDDGMLLPAEQPGHGGADRERVAPRLDDRAHRAGTHDLVDADRREV